MIKRSETVFNIFFHHFVYKLFLQIFFLHIKMSKDSSARYRNLSEGEKNKKQEYDRERYKNLSENENKNYLSIQNHIIKWEQIKHCYKQRLSDMF